MRLCVVLLCVSLISLSCSSDDTTTNPPPNTNATDVGSPVGTAVTKDIGPAGGEVTSADGSWALTIPDGALSATTAITLTPISNKAPLGIGNAIRCEPNGTVFAKPVRLILKNLDLYFKNGFDMSNMLVASQGSDKVWYSEGTVPSSDVTSALMVNITHFSDWAFASAGFVSADKLFTDVGEFVTLSVSAQANAFDVLAATSSNRVALTAPTKPSGVEWSLVRDSCENDGATITSASGADASIQTLVDTCDHIAMVRAKFKVGTVDFEFERTVYIGGYVEFSLDGKHVMAENSANVITMTSTGLTRLSAVSFKGEGSTIGFGWMGNGVGDYTTPLVDGAPSITLDAVTYHSSYIECQDPMVNLSTNVQVLEANAAQRYIRGTFRGTMGIIRGTRQCGSDPSAPKWVELPYDGSFFIRWIVI